MFISLYCVGQLCFLTLEKWPYIGDVLWGPAAHSPLVTRAICSTGATLCGLGWPFCCGWADYCGWTCRWDWSLAWLASRSCLIQRLPSAVGQGLAFCDLAAELLVIPNLPDHFKPLYIFFILPRDHFPPQFSGKLPLSVLMEISFLQNILPRTSVDHVGFPLYSQDAFCIRTYEILKTSPIIFPPN